MCHRATWLFPIATTILLAASPDILAASRLAFADLGNGGQACCLVPDASGNAYLVATIIRNGDADVSLTKFDSTNRAVASFTFGGGGRDVPHAAALDPQGNLIIAGETTSADFPQVGTLQPETAPGIAAAFVAKVNPATWQILFSTKLGGFLGMMPGPETIAQAVAVDSAGDMFVAGRTNAADFPVTSNAFQKTGPGGSAFGPVPFGFVTKFSPTGDRMLYSTLLGGSHVNCIGGSHCLGKNAYSAVSAIAVDATGNAVVAGFTNATDFPVTAGAFQSQCRCQEYAGNGFVARLNGDGSALVSSTFLGGTWYGVSSFPEGRTAINALSLTATGDAIVAGATDETDFPTTTSVVQPSPANPAPDAYSPRTTDGFVTRLNPYGTALIFSTFLGGAKADEIDALAVDSQGNLYVSGITASTDLQGPASATPFTGSFVVELNSGGSQVIQKRTDPAGVLGPALAFVQSDLAAAGLRGSVLRFRADQLAGAGVDAVVNSAGGVVSGSIAPGEFVSFYGAFGDPSAIEVTFDGVAATTLYAGANQINVVAPDTLYSKRTDVQVAATSGTYQFELYVKPAQPQVFRAADAFHAAALNQDGSINTSQNPAAPGSIVSIWVSGSGPRSLWPSGFTAVLQGSTSLEMLYAGFPNPQAPTAMQINFRLPQNLVASPYFLPTFNVAVGDYVSDGFGIWLTPQP